MGPSEILIVKADPRFFSISPFWENEKKDWADNPVSILGWTEREPTAVLFVNGGQYYRDRTSMGFVARKGEEVEPRYHPRWKGFLAHDSSRQGVPPFKVLDKDLPQEAEKLLDYGTLIQSYMVIDRQKRVRVRNTNNLASRVAIGEDQQGLISVVLVMGATSLYDLALLLEDLEIYPALGLDGGLETQMALLSEGTFTLFQGEYSHNAFGNIRFTDYHPSLPLVVALTPTKTKNPPEAEGAPVLPTPLSAGE
jgi:uncharacterized protein YigE (DUF2233 family)